MNTLIDPSLSTRELIRAMRSRSIGVALPESTVWHTYHLLRHRAEPDATRLFVDALRSLLARRRASETLPMADTYTDEHHLAEDPILADLWRAYKKCVASNRPGPAETLLTELTARLAVA